jgi:polyhydroxyalkanoate synthesis regulator phasin
MLQEDLKEVEAKILKSHAELLEYMNVMAESVNKLLDQFMILRERVQDLENAKPKK